MTRERPKRGEREREKEGDPAGETIHAIDEVDEVRDRDEPDHREDQAEGTGFDLPGPERVADHIDPHLAEIGRDADPDLHEKTNQGRQAEKIVEKSEEEHRGSQKKERPAEQGCLFRVRPADRDEASEKKHGE